MTDHPQFAELLAKLRDLLASHMGEVLIVHDPIEVQSITFAHDVRRVKRHPLDAVGETSVSFRMTFGFRLTDEAALGAAERLGLRPQRYTHAVLSSGQRIESFQVEHAFAGAEDGAELCFDVLRDVFRVPSDRWLFMTDNPEPDTWPCPLPRPDRWPPPSRVDSPHRAK